MSYYEYHVARRYVQFEGALRELPNYAALTGKNVLFLTACDPVRKQVEEKIREGLNAPAAAWMNSRLAAESPRYARYVRMTDRLDQLRRETKFDFFDLGNPVVSEENIRQFADFIKKRDIDTVVGIGGGKGQDFARALTHYLPLKVILVPTLAATNASISTLSVLYTPDGSRISQYWRMDNAPDLVLADTELLIENGSNVLSAGIGDIMSTYLEALCNLEMTGNSGILPELSYQSVRMAVEIFYRQVPDALKAVRERKINSAFENIVSMILHNPGPMGMICTLGLAHVFDEVFLHFDCTHKIPHGLRVGFASIPMLMYQKADPDRLKRYCDFCRDTGIPTSLHELGLDTVSKTQWMDAIRNTAWKSGTLKTLPFHISPEEMIECLFAVRQYERP